MTFRNADNELKKAMIDTLKESTNSFVTEGGVCYFQFDLMKLSTKDGMPIATFYFEGNEIFSVTGNDEFQSINGRLPFEVV